MCVPFTPPGSPSLSAEKASEGKWRISKDGGAGSYWGQDGKQLIFYKSRSVMSVGLSTIPSFHAGVPQELFQLPPDTVAGTSSRDLKKFLAAVPRQDDAAPPITVVLNWPSAIK